MEVKFRDKDLTLQERIKTIAEIDKLIQQYAESIPVYHSAKIDARTGNVPIKSLAKLEKPCARDPRSPVPLTLAVQNSLTL